MSAITPQVYVFAPGTATAAGVIDGIQRCIAAAGTHHWEQVSYAAGTSLTLLNKLTPAMTVTYTRIVLPDSINVTLTHPNGSTSPACKITGGNTTINPPLNDATWGISTTKAYVVEVEDAINVILEQKAGGWANAYPGGNGFSFAAMAGRLISALNRSDSEKEYGVICGIANISEGSTISMISKDTTDGGTAQSVAYTATGWERLCCTVGLNRRTSTQSNLLQNVGDSGGTERLVPFPLNGNVTTVGAYAGFFGHTRYVRARRVGIGGVIDNTTVIASQTSPTTIGWRHNAPTTAATIVPNAIWLWCAPGQEVIVP